MFYFFTFSSLVQKCYKIQRKSLRPFKNPPPIEIEKMRFFKISRMIYQSTGNKKSYLLWAQMKSMGSLHRCWPILALPSFVRGSFSERRCWYNIDIHIMRDQILTRFLLSPPSEPLNWVSSHVTGEYSIFLKEKAVK